MTLKRFNAFVYGSKENPLQELKETVKPVENVEPILESVQTVVDENISMIKEELCQKYLYSDDNNGVIGITAEKDDNGEYIQFNIECETELSAVKEYKGYRLKFNRLCEVPVLENTNLLICPYCGYSFHYSNQANAGNGFIRCMQCDHPVPMKAITESVSSEKTEEEMIEEYKKMNESVIKEYINEINEKNS